MMTIWAAILFALGVAVVSWTFASVESSESIRSGRQGEAVERALVRLILYVFSVLLWFSVYLVLAII